MPYYQNSLYGQGVPTYAEALSPLADVFKAYAPNPMRDLQIKSYMSRSNLEQVKGQQIQQELTGADNAADQFDKGNTQGALSAILRGANPQTMTAAPKFFTGAYGLRGIDDPNSVNQSALADAVVGSGGNYQDTQLGFNANQARQLQQNENTTAASRYGSDKSAGAAMYGHRLTAEVGHERNANVLTGTKYTSDNSSNATRYVGELNAKAAEQGHTLTAGTAREKNANDLTGTKYKADQSRLGKEFDTKNDVRKTTPKVNGGGSGGSGKPPAPGQMNTATAKALGEVFKRLPPGMDPTAVDDVKARATFYVNNGDAETRNNPVGAFLRAQSEVLGDDPQTTQETHWYGNEPQVTAALPAGQRPALPNPVANIFAAPSGSEQAVPSMPNAPGGAAPNSDAGLAKAAAAISSGAPRDAVVARLKQAGYSDQAIQQAGI